MTMTEIERLAASGEEAPETLEMAEMLLFLTLRELYSNYKNGVVTRERASREKQRIITSYNSLRMTFDIAEQQLKIRHRLEKNIGELYKCGCPHCKKLIDIFTGIDRKDIPDDIEELNARNERLTDMVKERSERNAELATIIDRIRWALEKNDIDRIKEIIKEK
jgi:flagellar biosynthesis/type III secretory pathway chaperone